MQNEESSYHYGVMRRAIAFIDAAEHPLSLPELAAQMQMSPSYFQRLFSQWVGVSPKAYQQYLSLEHAKSLLSTRKTTLETAQQIGLSGGGRLHDLFIKLEAMSPGEYARAGQDLRIFYDWFATPFGEALAMGTDRGLCGLAFAEELGRAACYRDMVARWPKATFMQSKAPLKTWLDGAFHGEQTARLHLIARPFQIKVWQALLAIPSGYVSTYSDIAQYIDAPKAVRAVGTAIGRNPISWLIPCHRALRKNGGLGGYHWGLTVKRTMLAYETAQADTHHPIFGTNPPNKQI